MWKDNATPAYHHNMVYAFYQQQLDGRMATDSMEGSSPESPHEDDERLVIDLSHHDQLYGFPSMKNFEAETETDTLEMRTAEDISNKSGSSFNETDDRFELDDSGIDRTATPELDGKHKKICSCAAEKSSYIEDMVQSLKSIAENSISASAAADSDKLFLLSLLPSMKKLSSEDNLAFRVESQQLLSRKLRVVDKKFKRRQPEFRYADIRNYTAANGKVLKDFKMKATPY